MVLPSLILRLERLEQPTVPLPQPDVLRVPERPITTDATTGRPAEDSAASDRLTSSTTLSRWSAAVAGAHDACFVLDVEGAMVSVSVDAVELLGSGDATVIGRHLLDVIHVVDLETGATNPEYAPRITPLVVLASTGLARSLMRIRHEDDAVLTLDTSSAPIHDVSGHLVGSITFIAQIAAS